MLSPLSIFAGCYFWKDFLQRAAIIRTKNQQRLKLNQVVGLLSNARIGTPKSLRAIKREALWARPFLR